MKTSIKILFTLTLIALLYSCDSDSNSDNAPGFDRQAMLDHYAENIITPAYANLQAAITALKANIDAFADTPTEENLVFAQSGWKQAYAAWQSANAFNFGPAGEQGTRKGLIEEIGTFPAATGKIETAIAAGDHSLNNFDRDARGFLALEYLLFGENKTATEVAGEFQASPARQAHVRAIVDHLKTRVDEVVNGWNTYQSEFIGDNGTSAGSSVSSLYNEFVRSFESAKNFKVGLPAGKRPGQTQPEPQLVEAYYSGESLQMLKLHLQAIENIHYGRGLNGATGSGFRDYLASVAGGSELIALTEAQWAKVEDALNAVPTDQPFSVLVANEHPAVDALHTELQKHTRFFKSDMSSLLGIAITFSSGDGD